jgi:toxin ParE1/3/4
MVEVKFTEQALKDIEEIAHFISADSSHYASLQVQKIISKTDILENFPKVGRIVPEVKHKSVRELIEGNYRIIYFIFSKTEIHILTVYHSSRKLKKTSLKKLIPK